MKKSLFETGAQRRGTMADETAAQSFVYRDHGPAAAASGASAPLEAAGMDLAAALAAEDEHRREQNARRQELDTLTQTLTRDFEQNLEHAVASERAALQQALAQFLDQQQLYFLRLEREVVQLALAVARKILHREAHVDPLLLAGAVRAALDQLAAGCEVELAVPPSTLAQWQQLLDATAARPAALRLLADPALEPNGCRLSTTAGSTELGLDRQLQNVEQAFLDLLARRTALARTAA